MAMGVYESPCSCFFFLSLVVSEVEMHVLNNLRVSFVRNYDESLVGMYGDKQLIYTEKNPPYITYGV